MPVRSIILLSFAEDCWLFTLSSTIDTFKLLSLGVQPIPSGVSIVE